MKIKIFLGMCMFFILCGCSNKQENLVETEQKETTRVESTVSMEVTTTKSATEEISSIEGSKSNKQEIVRINPFFINEGEQVYNARFSELSSNNEVEVKLLTEMVKEYENGILYEVKISSDKEVQDVYGTDRLNLGYFYVQSDKIYLIKDESVQGETMTEAELVGKGIIICQENEKKDLLLEDEKGWHEYILVDGDRREYHGYNTLVETGYYERFIWEAEKGLIEYKSGFGAENYDIQLSIAEPSVVIYSMNAENVVNEVTMSYGELEQYLEENFNSLQAECVVEISRQTDMEALLGDDYGWFCGGYVIKRTDDKCFLLAVFDVMSDDYVTEVFEMTDGKFVSTDSLSGASITGNSVSSDQIEMSLCFYMLGTYWSVMDYILDENGLLVQNSDIFVFEQNDDGVRNYELTVIKELPVTINGSSNVIVSGTKIKITGTNNIDEIYFVVPQTGEKGTIHYEMKEWDVYINGESESNFFEALPYVG